MSTTIFIHGPITEVTGRDVSGVDSDAVPFSIRTAENDVTFFPRHDDIPALVARLRTTANLLSLGYEKREQEDEECEPFGCKDRRTD